MGKYVMRKGFDVSNTVGRANNISTIACFNYEALNKIVNSPYFSDLPIVNIVGVWKPKGSPSLLWDDYKANSRKQNFGLNNR